MKKLPLIVMALMLSISAIAQQKIQLRSVDKAECVKSDMRILKASFSFSTIEAQDYQRERGSSILFPSASMSRSKAMT